MHGCCSINHLTRWSYAPAWKRAGQFDAEQPFPVIRHRTSLMLPEPMVLNKARDIAAGV